MWNPNEHLGDSDNWAWDTSKGRWVFLGNKRKGKLMQEKILPRPDLWVGYRTGNVLLRVGTEVVYVKVVSDTPDKRDGKVRYFPVPGARRNFRECLDLKVYDGPLDDQIIVNLLVYGG
jgi:hypothetical protein